MTRQVYQTEYFQSGSPALTQGGQQTRVFSIAANIDLGLTNSQSALSLQKHTSSLVAEKARGVKKNTSGAQLHVTFLLGEISSRSIKISSQILANSSRSAVLGRRLLLSKFLWSCAHADLQKGLVAPSPDTRWYFLPVLSNLQVISRSSSAFLSKNIFFSADLVVEKQFIYFSATFKATATKEWIEMFLEKGSPQAYIGIPGYEGSRYGMNQGANQLHDFWKEISKL